MIQLSRVNPDWDDLVQQLQRALQGKGAWRDHLPTGAGQAIVEMIAAIGELDQYSNARTFEEMFSETAQIDSSVYSIIRMLGVRMQRKSPAYLQLRPDGEGVTNNNAILEQAENNPYYDTSIPVGSDLSVRITDPDLFWGFNKLRRIQTDSFHLTSSMTIPPYTQFSTSEGILFNRQAIYFPPAPNSSVGANHPSRFGRHIDGNGRDIPVRLYKGNVHNRFFSATGRDFYSIISNEDEFTISNEDVSVFVNGLPINVVHQGLWNFRRQGTGTIYCQDMTTRLGQLHLLFGSSRYGGLVTNTDLIRLRYVTTDGAGDNNTTFNSLKLACRDFPSIDVNNDVLIGSLSYGTNERSADHYKLSGPVLFSADQGFAAVRSDQYKELVVNYPGVLDANVMPQRKTNPDNPYYMNLIKVDTYPKRTREENEEMFSTLENRSMFSNRFYTTYENNDPSADALPTHPIYREMNVYARVFCRSNVDLMEVRDRSIEPAILSLFDRAGSPMIGKLSQDISLDSIYDAIKNSNSGISRVQLLEPTDTVTGDLVAPEIVDYNITSGGLSGTWEFAVVYRCNRNSISPGAFDYTGVDIGRTITVPLTGQDVIFYFNRVPNFNFTLGERYPGAGSGSLTEYQYLSGEEYIIVGRNLNQPQPNWVLINHTLTPQQGDLMRVQTTGSTGAVFTNTQNTTNPALPVLVSSWSAERTIEMYYEGQGGL